MNILIGVNNSGKSTILNAFRILNTALRQARSKTPEVIPEYFGIMVGYNVSIDNSAVSTANIHTDYNDIDTTISFRLSNGNHLRLIFPNDGGCFLIADAQGKKISNTTLFKKEFPVSVGIIPVLGPLEIEEEIRSEETVRRGLMTHRASSQFRNYWYYYRDGFDKFAKLVMDSWFGMEITRPKKADIYSKKLSMFCYENRIAREIAWAGFGFQIWCQLLTNISLNESSTILIVDEPEIYLHPDLQRHLVTLFRDSGCDILLATHSPEIIGEAEASEIIVIDKADKSATRLHDIEGVQNALSAIGSIHNLKLSKLARTKRILFIEGQKDFSIISKFARRLNFTRLATGDDISIIETGGFSYWERIKNFAWGF